MNQQRLLSGLFLVAVGLAGEVAGSSDGFRVGGRLDYELVSTRPWPEVCWLYKEALSELHGPWETYAGEVDITKLGDWKWNYQGLWFGAPIEPDITQSVTVAGFDEAGALAIWKARKPQLWFITLPQLELEDNYWGSRKAPPTMQQRAMSEQLFGQKPQPTRITLENFDNTPNDLECLDDSRETDVLVLEALLGKRDGRLAAGIEYGPTYRVEQGDWTGSYRCGASSDGQKVMSLELVSSGEWLADTADMVLLGSVWFEGGCPEFEGIAK
jgi:hypothetical protein